MTNRYLTKIAKTDIADRGTGLRNIETAPRATLKEPVKADPVAKTLSMPHMGKEAGVVQGVKDFYKGLDGVNKLKLGMSGSGLALGTAGFVESRKKMKGDRHRENLEAQSLDTLKKIHEALEKQKEVK